MAYTDIINSAPTTGMRRIRKNAKAKIQRMIDIDASDLYRSEYSIVASWCKEMYPEMQESEISRLYWALGQTLGSRLPVQYKVDEGIRANILNELFLKNAAQFVAGRGSMFQSWMANGAVLACKAWYRPRMADRAYSMSDRTGENGGLTEGADQMAYKGGQYATDTDTVGNSEMVAKVREVLGDDFAFFQYRSQHTGEETAMAFGMLPPNVCKKFAAMRERVLKALSK